MGNWDEEKAVYPDERPSVVTKTTLLQKHLAEQEEILSCLNQKLTSVLRRYEEEKDDRPGPVPVSTQSPLLDELDLIASRVFRHNAMLTDMLHRLDT